MDELNFDGMNYDEVAERLEKVTPEQLAHLLSAWADTIEERGFDLPVQMVCCAILRESAHRSIEVDEKLKQATEDVMSRLTGIFKKAKENTDECSEAES